MRQVRCSDGGRTQNVDQAGPPIAAGCATRIAAARRRRRGVGEGLVDEQPPDAVLGALQALHDGGVGPRRGRRAMQMHVGGLRGAAALARVARHARCHQGLPGDATRRGSAGITWSTASSRLGESLAAVVAATKVARVDVAAVRARPDPDAI